MQFFKITQSPHAIAWFENFMKLQKVIKFSVWAAHKNFEVLVIFYIILPNVSQKMKQEILSIKIFNFRDKVWAVKWYRGNFEIFRFIADETPPTKVFKLDHFDVDVSKSWVDPCYQLKVSLSYNILNGKTLHAHWSFKELEMKTFNSILRSKVKDQI